MSTSDHVRAGSAELILPSDPSKELDNRFLVQEAKTARSLDLPFSLIERYIGHLFLLKEKVIEPGEYPDPWDDIRLYIDEMRQGDSHHA